MLRMEVALFLVLAFVAYIYFSAEKPHTQLHQTFSALLVTALVHLVLDGTTVYTVNHLDTVPRLLNDAVHRLFIGSMVLVIYLFYQYIAILVEEETGKPRQLDRAAKLFLAAAVLGSFLLPMQDLRKANGLPASMPVFTLQGGFDMTRLRGVYKLMMTVMVKTAGKGLAEKQDRTPDEDAMLELMLHGGSRVSEENLAAVWEWCQQAR